MHDRSIKRCNLRQKMVSRKSFKSLFWLLSIICLDLNGVRADVSHKNAYATMMYMGTPRDYEFYIAIRVMLRSLSKLRVDADLVVIASVDVPARWMHTMEEEDGAKVVRVENLNNPYISDTSHDRFKLTLNKLYAWSLVEYERVVMLDADNLFLQKTDELFQCGQFCAVFINPCVFHTGLFVLEPSSKVYKDMLRDLDNRRDNPDGADQGFIGGYFPDLLDQPMFHPPSDGTKLDGTFRLPLGYQMDASYYYLRLRWSVPCGPNSVITFPGASWLKPWYWWSWPVLPLGIQWHEQRRETIGYSMYDSEMPFVLIQTIIYLCIIAVTRLARPTLTKLCYRGADKNLTIIQTSLKAIAILSIIISYMLPFMLVPHTIHPILGWTMYLLGSFALSCITINVFLLPLLPVLTPWLGIIGVLLVMACPWYTDGVVRALSVFAYAFCVSPVLWISMGKIRSSLHISLEREGFLPSRLTDSTQSNGFNKLY
ncbi:putative glycogenin glucosyltransferase [Helianthus annuus]|uniref:Glycogenin glucosyltransferase n=1 Tax=Helianthus annuus TaxID=4232 RepID=A0A251RPM4_HELAN|nr:putative glycogenin glucosyltransferase [Helianthus annuus]KAJ0429003.1 putative glycogenin glucosyltransferase [Helianthus annuus]KAJ0812987.1 putative glycogenin glucosyltransferase [Helianthus annuus]